MKPSRKRKASCRKENSLAVRKESAAGPDLICVKRKKGKRMPLQMVRNDITRMQVDAIVNAANSSLLGGGGVDGAIHRAAGPGLTAACRTLGGCAVGEAKLTAGYELPCRYVIHTVGPVWQGGEHGERALLASCYRRSLELARQHDCETVAFPLISTGAYGYPKPQAIQVAVETIVQFLMENDMTVYLVVFSKDALMVGGKLFGQVTAYIDDVYVDTHLDLAREEARRIFRANYLPEQEPCPTPPAALPPEKEGKPTARPVRDGEQQCADAADCQQANAGPRLLRRIRCRPDAQSSRRDIASEQKCYACPPAAAPIGLEKRLEEIDESFSQMLIRKIDEKRITDADCYKRANIDRRLFHKIKTNPDYKPGKQTVMAFAIALELPLEETRELMMKAGFALSHSSKADIVVEYFIMNRNYNIFELNEVLFDLDLQPLGC